MIAPTGAVLRHPGALPAMRRAPAASSARRLPPHPALRRAAVRPTAPMSPVAILDARILCQKAVPWLKLAAGILAAATAALAIHNNLNQEQAAPVYEMASANNQTVVYRKVATAALAGHGSTSQEQPAPGFELASASSQTMVYRKASTAPFVPQIALEDLSVDRADEGIGYSTPKVQTIRFLNPGRREAARTAPPDMSPELERMFEPGSMTRVSGFVAFSGKEAARGEAEPASDARPDVPRRRSSPLMEEVDNYLWEVYQREPIKKDGSGDFTWKDPAAAKRLNMSLQDYVIGGMDPDFREQLYHAGKAMDAAGIQWAILSAFRDDYRQGIASGFKARTGNSLHGGSRVTGGYGHGRAVDIIGQDKSSGEVWHWIDAHGAKYGLVRPIPGPDPAHVQSRGDWHKIAQSLRTSRVQVAEAPANGGRATAKGKVVAAAK